MWVEGNDKNFLKATFVHRQGFSTGSFSRVPRVPLPSFLLQAFCSEGFSRTYSAIVHRKFQACYFPKRPYEMLSGTLQLFFFLCLVELHRKKHAVDHSNSTAHIKPPLLCTYQGAVYIRTDINYRVTHSCSILALPVSAYSSPQPLLPTASHTMLRRETLRSSSHQDTALKSHFLADEQHLKVTHLNAVSEK